MARLSLRLSKFHVVGNHMSRLNYFINQTKEIIKLAHEILVLFFLFIIHMAAAMTRTNLRIRKVSPEPLLLKDAK